MRQPPSNVHGAVHLSLLFQNVQTRNEIAKINEIGAGTVSNIQVMSLVFGASKAIHSKE
jgi:hypothetical protein